MKIYSILISFFSLTSYGFFYDDVNYQRLDWVQTNSKVEVDKDNFKSYLNKKIELISKILSQISETRSLNFKTVEFSASMARICFIVGQLETWGSNEKILSIKINSNSLSNLKITKELMVEVIESMNGFNLREACGGAYGNIGFLETELTNMQQETYRLINILN